MLCTALAIDMRKKLTKHHHNCDDQTGTRVGLVAKI